MNKIYSYDVEIFPNYFCVSFVDVEEYLAKVKPLYGLDKNGYPVLTVSEEEKINIINSVSVKQFEISYVEGREVNESFDMFSFFNQEGNYVTGFNILRYDNNMMRAVFVEMLNSKSVKEMVRKLYLFSKDLIEKEFYELQNNFLYNAYLKYEIKPKSIDLQKIPALDKVLKSLKQTLINLKWHRILDYHMPPISQLDRHYYRSDLSDYFISTIKDWDRMVVKEYVPDILDYNINDTLGCCDLFRVLLNQIRLRFNIGAKYNINVLSASNSKIADIFISRYYSEYTGIPYNMYAKLRTYRKSIRIGEILNPIITFQTPECNQLLEKFKAMVVSTTKEIEITFKLGNTKYKFGSGGLHSVDKAKLFEESEDYEIKDADVASYYPTLTINNKAAPAHLDRDAFIAVCTIMKNERIEAKHNAKDPKYTKQEQDYFDTTANSLKITINVGMFGKFGFEYSFLYDLLCTLQITLNGQLNLIMLIEDLYLNGIETVSANTDGIVCIIPKDKQELYKTICKNWEKKVNLELEFTQYVKYARRDVNNYLTVKKGKDGKLSIKRKGDFNQYLYTEDLQKGFDMPIIAKAVEEYLVYNVPIRDTINNERDIYMFCVTQNINSKFFTQATSISSTGEVVKERLQKNIRFYCSKDNKIVFKIEDFVNDSTAKKSNLKVGTGITIFNDYFSVDNFKDYNINYPFYIKLAEQIAYGVISGRTSKKVSDRKARQNIFHTGRLF